MEKSRYRYIAKPKSGKRWAIGDIHGCAKTLKNLIWEKLELLPEDQLFLVGDYLNRGPDSLGVVDFILELQTKGYQVFTLKGNHEEMFLDSLNRRDEFAGIPQLQKRNYASQMKDEQGKLLSKYQAFFDDLLYYIDTGDFYISHAGFKFSAPNPLEDYQGMLWVRHFNPSVEVLGERRLIHGHTRRHLSVIRALVAEKALVIPIDNGCYEAQTNRITNPERGHLCAFCLDTFELVAQVNID